MAVTAPTTYGSAGGFYAGPTSAPYQAPVGTGEGVSVSDYLTNFYSSGLSLVSQVPAYSRYLRSFVENPDAIDEEQDRYHQETLRRQQDQLQKGMSPDAQRLLNADLISGDFWSQPLPWLGLQISGAAPQTATAIAVGALTGPAGGFAALTAAGAAGGVMSAGDMLETVQRSVDERSDEENQRDSPIYRQMREAGHSEEETRRYITKEMTGTYRVPLLIAAGTALDAIGVPGQYLRAAGIGRRTAEKMLGAAPRGMARRVGREAATGAATEAVQTGIESLTGQAAGVQAGYLPGIDVGEALSQAATGAVVGGAMGGPTGIAGGRAGALPTQPAAGAAVPPVQAVPAGPPPGNLGLGPSLPLTPAQVQGAELASSPEANLFNVQTRWQQQTPEGVQVALPLGPTSEQQTALLAQSPETNLFNAAANNIDQVMAQAQQEAQLQPGGTPQRTGLPPSAVQQALPLGEPVPVQRELPLAAGPPGGPPAPPAAGPPPAPPAPQGPVGPPELAGPPVQQRPLPFTGPVPQPREPSAVERIMKKAGVRWGTFSRLESHMRELPDDELHAEAATQAPAGDAVQLLRRIAALQEYALRQEHGERTAERAAEEEPPPAAPYPFASPEEQARVEDFVRRNVQEGINEWVQGTQLSLRKVLPDSISEEEQEVLDTAHDEDMQRYNESITRLRQLEARQQSGVSLNARELAELEDLHNRLYGRGPSVSGPVGPVRELSPQLRRETEVTTGQVLEPLPTGAAAEPTRSHKGAEEQAARAEENQRTQELFNEFIDEPESYSTGAALDRLNTILRRAKELGIRARTRIGYETTANETFWLTEARRLRASLMKGAMTNEKLSDLRTFQASEAMARQGDWSGFIESRRIEGELQSTSRKKAGIEREEKPGRVTGLEAQTAEAVSEEGEPLGLAGQPGMRVEGEAVKAPEARAAKGPGVVRLRTGETIAIPRVGARPLKPSEKIKSTRAISYAKVVGEIPGVPATRSSRVKALTAQIKELSQSFKQSKAKNLLVEATKKLDRIAQWLTADSKGLQVPDLGALVRGTQEDIAAAQKAARSTNPGFARVTDNLDALHALLPKPLGKGLTKAQAVLAAKRQKARTQKELLERRGHPAKAQEALEAKQALRAATAAALERQRVAEKKAAPRQVAKLAPAEKVAEVKARAKSQTALEKLHQKAYAAGTKAFNAGKARSDNPHRGNTRVGREWERGWVAAQRDAAALENARLLAERAEAAAATQPVDPYAKMGEATYTTPPPALTTKAEILGLKMSRAGASLDSNPYKLETKRQEWERGFHVGKARAAEAALGETTYAKWQKWKSRRTLKSAKAGENRIDLPEGWFENLLAAGHKLTPYGPHLARQLERFDSSLQPLRGPVRALMPKAIRQIIEMNADVQALILPDEVFQSVVGVDDAAGLYNFERGVVVLPEGSVGTWTALHEATHAALMPRVYAHAGMTRTLERIFTEARAAAPDPSAVYGLNDIDELAAEGIGNPEFSEFLQGIDSSPELKEQLQLNDLPPARNLWQAFLQLAQKALNLVGLGRNDTSLLAALLKHISQLSQEQAAPAGDAAALSRFDRQRTVKSIRRNVTERAQWMQSGTPKALSWRTNDQIAQLAKDFGGAFGRAVRNWADAVEKVRVTADGILQRFEPVLDENYKMSQKYKGTAEWQSFTNLVHDEQMLNVDAAKPLSQQPWLGQNLTVANAAARNKWMALNQAWQALPADLKNLRKISYAHYSAIQNETAVKLANNRLARLFGVDDTALAQRIIDGSETPADVARVGSEERVDIIREAAALTTKQGPYAPLMRYGKFVVNGKYKVNPGRGRLIPDTNDLYEFRSEAEAIGFAQKQDVHVSGHSVWVDRTTGNTHVIDANGNEVRVSKNDTNAEQRFRVRVGIQHTEMFDTRKEADAAARDLEASGVLDGSANVQLKRYEERGRSVDLLSSRLDHLIHRMEKDAAYQAMTPSQKNELKRVLEQGAISMLGSTRIQAHRLPRRYVQGASKNFTRAALDYSVSAAGYLAKLDHQPAIDDAVKRIVAGVNDPADASKEAALPRSAISNEVAARSVGADRYENPQWYESVAKRVASAAYSYFLASPAYSITNLMQTPMVSMPISAGRHGLGKTLRHYDKAYKDVSGMRILGAGIKATAKRVLSSGKGEDFVERIITGASNLLQNERAMLNQLREVGTLGGDVGIEASRLIRQGDERTALAAADTVINHMGEIARALPRAVESVNRAVTALASYRMELEKNGGDHDAAVAHAQEHVNLTHGLYSSSDAPRAFRSPLLQSAFVFKKYPQLILGLIGHEFGRVIRDANPGDRAEALRSLGYFMGATALMAGALGLPLEPFKILLTAANLASGDKLKSWDEVEHDVRQALANVAGETGGEVLSRGLPRLLGVDLSSRVGLQDLMFYGAPRTSDPHDFFAWVGEMVGGAPASMVIGNMIPGVRKMVMADDFSGFVEGAEKVLPMKMLQDVAKTYRETTVGKRTAADYEAYGPTTMLGGLARTAGFTPASVAEAQERRTYFYQAEKRLVAGRDELLHKWQKASGSERSRLWPQIVAWNRGQDPGAQLKRADLNSYAKRRAREKAPQGFRLTRVNEGLFQQMQGTYNVGP